MWALTLGCYIPAQLSGHLCHRSWSSKTRCSTVPSLHSPSLAAYPQWRTLLRCTTRRRKGQKGHSDNTCNVTHSIRRILRQHHIHSPQHLLPPQANETLNPNETKQLAPSTFSGPQRVPSMGESSLERQEPFTEHQRIWQTFWKERHKMEKMIFWKRFQRSSFFFFFRWSSSEQYSHQPQGRRSHSGHTGAGTGGVWCSGRQGERAGWSGLSWMDGHPDRNPSHDCRQKKTCMWEFDILQEATKRKQHKVVQWVRDTHTHTAEKRDISGAGFQQGLHALSCGYLH